MTSSPSLSAPRYTASCRPRATLRTRTTAQAEQVKRFTILNHDLTPDTGELTPTLKVKRNVVCERYADVFDQLYVR